MAGCNLLILLTLFFKSIFFKTNFNYSYVLLTDIFSIITQWGFCKYMFYQINSYYLVAKRAAFTSNLELKH